MLLTTFNGPIATDTLISKLGVRRDVLSELLGHRIHRGCFWISSADLTSTSMPLKTTNGSNATDTSVSKVGVRPDMLSELLGHRMYPCCS